MVPCGLAEVFASAESVTALSSCRGRVRGGSEEARRMPETAWLSALGTCTSAVALSTCSPLSVSIRCEKRVLSSLPHVLALADARM